MDTTTISGSGTVISGDAEIHSDYFIGRDNITNNYIDTAPGFATITTSAYSEALYVSPVFTGRLFEQLKERRLLLVAGESDFDKQAFVRHLSHLLTQDFPGISVKEWSDPEDADKLVWKIMETEEPSVFVIPNAAPKDIAYDPARLSSLARERGHYFLLTTEISKEIWNLLPAVADLYWFEVPLSGLYSKEKLVEVLIRELNSYRAAFGITADGELTADLKIGEAFTISSLAGSFERPSEIQLLIIQLTVENESLSLEQKIRNAIRNITDKKESLITKWFRTLDTHEKLVVLGAALLDGLFDDQYFAVMQQIADDFWQYRSSTMRSLDYCDLDFLLNFFKFETLDDGRLILESKFPNQRAEIIKAAWGGHKRHILSAFTILTNLAGSSSAASSNRVTDPEINGTIEKGKRLRAVTAETISDIGIVSLQTAEPKLLALASSGDETTRRITAKAVARWRTQHKADQMFETLAAWRKKRSSAIRNSVVFSLQYAAEYDSPSALDPRIISLLNDMSGDEDIMGTMKNILQRLIANHLSQVKDDLLENFAIRSHYGNTIAISLSQKYLDSPEEIRSLLMHWTDSCFDQASQLNRRDKPTYRDNVIILVLSVYKLIPYSGENDIIPVSDVWDLLNRLHKQEQRSSMRNFLLETAAFLISAQPEHAVRHIEPIFARIGLYERLGLVQSIGSLYLQQRAVLSGGELIISKDEVEYPAWVYAKRPDTAIESILYSWIQGDHAFSRQLATLAFVEFARVFDLEEPRLIQFAQASAVAAQQERLRQQQEQQYRQRAEQAIIYPVMPELSLWTRIKIFFWLLFCDTNEKMLHRELMRTLLMYKQTNHTLLQAVVLRWNRSSNPKMQRMAWWIGKLIRM